jgi:hypothetical protein
MLTKDPRSVATNPDFKPPYQAAIVAAARNNKKALAFPINGNSCHCSSSAIATAKMAMP